MDTQFDQALADYSAGKLSRHELQNQTGLWFGDVLLELAKRGLQLPRFDPAPSCSAGEQAIYNELFRQS